MDVQIKPSTDVDGDGKYTVSFVSTAAGKHSVDVRLDGKEITISPLIVNILPGYS